MTTAQRKFWEGVRDYARAVRRMRKVDLDVAADALALEQEIEQRLAEVPAAEQLVAEGQAKGGN